MNNRKNFTSINNNEEGWVSEEDEAASTVDTEAKYNKGFKIQRIDHSIKAKFKSLFHEGSLGSSVFALIIICLGAGTLSIPYVFYENGIIIGSILLVLGGILSIYTGYLLVISCDILQVATFEEIALKTYGKKVSLMTSICMLACLLGFVVSYIVLVNFISVTHLV